MRTNRFWLVQFIKSKKSASYKRNEKLSFNSFVIGKCSWRWNKSNDWYSGWTNIKSFKSKNTFRQKKNSVNIFTTHFFKMVQDYSKWSCTNVFKLINIKLMIHLQYTLKYDSFQICDSEQIKTGKQWERNTMAESDEEWIFDIPKYSRMPLLRLLSTSSRYSFQMVTPFLYTQCAILIAKLKLKSLKKLSVDAYIECRSSKIKIKSIKGLCYRIWYSSSATEGDSNWDSNKITRIAWCSGIFSHSR